MCYNPLPVETFKRLRYYSPQQKYVGAKHFVPCGQCAECRAKTQQEWFLRARAEGRHCLSRGGKILFLTFTYRESDVPLYVPHYDNGLLAFKEITGLLPAERPAGSFMCFNHKHFRNYLKSFRKVFERAGFFETFKYIITSEYGTDIRYTQRPHYHVLFFLPPEIHAYIVHCVGPHENDIVRFFAKYWHYGFVSKSNEYGLYVNSDRCARYVSKYVTKDINYVNHPSIHMLLNTCPFDFDYLDAHKLEPFKVLPIESQLSDDAYFLFTKCKNAPDFLVKLNKFYGKVVRYLLNHYGLVPRHFQSIGFGLSMVDYIVNADSLDEMVNNYDKGVTVIEYGKSRSVPYPKYIKTKLMYDMRRDGTFRLNSFGLYYKQQTLKNSIQAQTDKFFELLQKDFRSLPKDVLSLSMDKLFTVDKSQTYSFFNHTQLFNFYYNLVSQPLFCYRAAAYNLIARGTICHGLDNALELLQYIDTLTPNSDFGLLSKFFDDNQPDMDQSFVPIAFKEYAGQFFGAFHGEYYPISSLYHSLKYELFLTLYNIISNGFKKLTSEAYARENNIRKRTKDIINSKSYKHA